MASTPSNALATDKELCTFGGTKTPPSSPSPSVVNEEGDASTSLNMELKQMEPVAPEDNKQESDPLGRQRLGAYKHFARAANRTLTSFTNEMSEILRQSIERLDTISMKVRGCVYDMERQRVGMPLAGISEEMGEDCDPSAEAQIPQVQQPIATTCLFKGQSNLTEIVEDMGIWNTTNSVNSSPRNSKTVELIKEIAVKCRKMTSECEQTQVLGQKTDKDKPAASPDLAPFPSEKLQMDLLHQNISERQQKQIKAKKSKIRAKPQPPSPLSSPQVPTSVSPTTSRRNPSDMSEVSLAPRGRTSDEKQVMQKIIKIHRRTMKAARRNQEGEDSSDLDREQPLTPSKPKQKAIMENDQQLSRLRDRYETRYRRTHRKRDATTAPVTHSPTQKRAKRSKLINEAYVKENYNDSLWFGPKLSNIVQEAPKKEAPRSVPSTKSSNKTNKHESLPSASKMLARKFGNSNFHDPSSRESPPRVESYTGGKVVRLTSDSKQDWSVIMHTQKCPTKYELKQNSPFPTNNILDEVTLKDLEPLKAEYPRRDNLSQTQPRLEDSLLYKLVHGDVMSLEHLIDVSSASKHLAEDAKKLAKRKPLKQISILSPAAHIQMPNVIITSTTGVGTALSNAAGMIRNDQPPVLKVHSKMQTSNVSRDLYKNEAEAKRAGINRSPDRRKEMVPTSGKKKLSAKQIVAMESKRIAKKLSEIKDQTDREHASTKSISVQDYQSFRQISKKDARRRLKKYIVDPNKVHQKYMVMMVDSIEYDRYDLGCDGRYHQKQQVDDVAAFLAPYIYHNDVGLVVPQVEYTVAVMTPVKHSSDGRSGGSPPRRKSFGVSPGTGPEPDVMYHVKPTRDRERLTDVLTETRNFRGRRRFESMVTQTGSSRPTPKSDAASWKHAIRTYYVPRESMPHHQVPPPRSTNMDVFYSSANIPMETTHVRSLISNMEQQLKQVMENPKIENKSLVIKSLQDEMEWILTNLEGHTNSLKKRKSAKKAETQQNDKKKTTPILKPVETLKAFKASKAVAIPATMIVSSQQYSYDMKDDSSGHLRKSVGTTELNLLGTSAFIKMKPREDNIQSKLLMHPSTSARTVHKDDIQSKLMSKWQALEHPSSETLESKSLKDMSIQLMENKTSCRILEPKKVKSRPETRRENRSSFIVSKHTSGSSTSRKDSDSIDSGRYITECPEHVNLLKRRSEQVSNQALDQLLAKLEDDDEDIDRPSSSETNESSSGEGEGEIPTNDKLEGEEQDTPAMPKDNGMTKEEVKEYKKNFQLFGNKLGVETQRFVSEMSAVMEKIETKNVQAQKDLEGNETDEIVEIVEKRNSVEVHEGDNVEVMSCKSSNSNPETLHTLTMWEQCTMVPSVKTLQSDAGFLANQISSMIISPSNEGTPSPKVSEGQSCTPTSIHVFQMFKPPQYTSDSNTANSPRLNKTYNILRPFTPPAIVTKTDKLRGQLVDRDPLLLFRDGLEARSMDSPMMCDIKRRLFGEDKPKAKVVASIPERENVVSAKRTHMAWQTSDKCTGTASLTNLGTFSKGTQHSSTLAIKESHSEITLKVHTIDSRTLRAATIQSKDTLSVRMKTFLNNTTLAHMSDSLEDVLASTLAATLANQEAIKQTFYNKKDTMAGKLLPCVYGMCFAVVSIALTFRPMCVA